jgi:hypothetical protein
MYAVADEGLVGGAAGANVRADVGRLLAALSLLHRDTSLDEVSNGRHAALESQLRLTPTPDLFFVIPSATDCDF